MPRLFVDDRIVITRGSVTFVAGTTGAIAQHTVFTITGLVVFSFWGRCTAPLTSGGAATISYGRAAAVNELIAVTTATTIDTDDCIAGGNVLEAGAFGTQDTLIENVSGGEDLTADILTATITGGTMEYYLFWTPISVGATVALGSELTQI